jgi:hypothetical protein
MFRPVLVPVCVAVLVSAASALAQAPAPRLASTDVSRTVFLSLDAVQAQVDAAVERAATSKAIIAEALLPAPAPLLTSTPIPRR